MTQERKKSQQQQQQQQQMDLFARDKVFFSIWSLLWSSSRICQTNGCCSHSRMRRVIEKKRRRRTRTRKGRKKPTKEKKRGIRKNRNKHRRFHSRNFFFFSDVFRSSRGAFVFSLNFTAVDNLFVCSCKTCSLAKFDYIYIYNMKSDEEISSGACKKLNLSSIDVDEEWGEGGGQEKRNCAYNISTSSISKLEFDLLLLFLREQCHDKKETVDSWKKKDGCWEIERRMHIILIEKRERERKKERKVKVFNSDDQRRNTHVREQKKKIQWSIKSWLNLNYIWAFGLK